MAGTEGRPSRATLTEVLVERLSPEVGVVSGIGNSSFDLHAAGHRPLNFYMQGSMGQAVPIALGLALAQPDRRIVALEGDGSLLMNLSGLATVGLVAPPNLTIVVWNNGAWQITGRQRVSSDSTCDLAAVAAGCGIAKTERVSDVESFRQAISSALDEPGPQLIAAEIDLTPPLESYHEEPARVTYSFMDALGVPHRYP